MALSREHALALGRQNGLSDSVSELLIGHEEAEAKNLAATLAAQRPGEPDQSDPLLSALGLTPPSAPAAAATGGEVDRVEIALRHGLSVEVAPDLRGESRAELEADAAARSAVASLFAPKRGEAEVLRALGVLGAEEQEPSPDEAAAFDGGAREPAPLPGDPVAEFNAAALEHLVRARFGPRDTFYEDGD